MRAVAQLGSALDWGSRGRRFKSCQPDSVMSQDIADARTHGCGFGRSSFPGGSGWSAGGLVVAGGVDGEFAQEFTGGGVDDADVQVLDQEQDVGFGVGSADADVVQAA